tara:strand:- start:27516 stop:27776 length:261 start_codon:yes stop_codon:yes gene_type:complete
MEKTKEEKKGFKMGVFTTAIISIGYSLFGMGVILSAIGVILMIFGLVNIIEYSRVTNEELYNEAKDRVEKKYSGVKPLPTWKELNK